MEFVNPLNFGKKSNDDTLIIQQALDSLNDGDSFILPNGIFQVTNLVIPDKKNITLEFYGSLRAIDGGDNDYLLATYKYVNNITEAGQSIKIINPKIDGSGIIRNGLVVQTWSTTIEKPEIFNCSNGLKITSQTKNGLNFRNSTLVNITINNPNIRNNTNKGIWICDPGRNKITDYFITNGLLYGNAGGGIYADSCAGALIQGVHTYANKSAVYVNIASPALRIHDCYFEEEDSVRFNEFNENTFVSMQGNTLNGNVFLYSLNKNTGLKGIGNTFRTKNGKYIQQWGNTIILSTGDTFETSDPYRLVGMDGVSANKEAPNIAHAQNCLSTLIGMNKIIQGVQKNNIVNTINI